MTWTTSTTAWLAACLALVGCAPLVEQKKEYKYEVSLQVGGESIVLAGTYTCILDGPMLSERGPVWGIVSESGPEEFAAVGRSASGVTFQARPRGVVLPDSYCEPTNSRHAPLSLNSRVLFRENSSDTYRSLDTGEVKQTRFGEIKVNSSTVSLVHSGPLVSTAQVTHPGESAHYAYSISATSRSVAEFSPDLAAYLASQKRLWLGESALMPFDSAAWQELEPGFKFRGGLWPFPGTGSEELVMEKSNTSSWHVSALQEWIELPGQLPDLDPKSLYPGALGADWIDFESSRIEFPLAQLAWRYAYDPRTKRVVTFRIEQFHLVNQ